MYNVSSDKLPDDELKRRLAEAGKVAKVGGRYRHYKGQEYTVLDLVIIEATNEVGVVYRPEYGAKLHFLRPMSNWAETVPVDGREVPRFLLKGEEGATGRN
jgi:hypothetical protein